MTTKLSLLISIFALLNISEIYAENKLTVSTDRIDSLLIKAKTLNDIFIEENTIVFQNDSFPPINYISHIQNINNSYYFIGDFMGTYEGCPIFYKYRKVYKYDTSGHFVTQLGAPGKINETQYGRGPERILYTGKNIALFCENDPYKIMLFNENGLFLKNIKTPGCPRFAMYNPLNNLFYCEFQGSVHASQENNKAALPASRFVAIDSVGKIIYGFGKTEYEFDSIGIGLITSNSDIDNKGNCWVGATFEPIVYLYDKNGKLMKQIDISSKSRKYLHSKDFMEYIKKKKGAPKSDQMALFDEFNSIYQQKYHIEKIHIIANKFVLVGLEKITQKASPSGRFGGFADIYWIALNMEGKIINSFITDEFVGKSITRCEYYYTCIGNCEGKLYLGLDNIWMNTGPIKCGLNVNIDTTHKTLSLIDQNSSTKTLANLKINQAMPDYIQPKQIRIKIMKIKS
ncbi:MAG: hypothetical protein PHC61_00160 [Chitinivibrionales bacterium]|nr:hypothetical protein [Chitinivibrionales bacterium]